MRGKMREGSAAKAEAPQKIDDDQAEQPSMSDAAPPPRPGAGLPITPVQIVIRYECFRSPISMWGGHTADRWTPSTPRWRGHPLMQALLHWSLSPMGEVERSTVARSRSASLS